MIPEYLDFSSAKHFKSKIVELFATENSAHLDLRHVNRASLACVQLLLAAKIKSQKDGIALSIEYSDHLKMIIQQLGLDEILA